MESEPVYPAKGMAPVASMVSRVAELWRAQGDEFLQRTHEAVAGDVERLRDTSIIAPDAPEPARPERHHRMTSAVGVTVHRLNEWDHQVIDGMRAWREGGHGHLRRVRPMRSSRPDDVVDLRTPDAVVDLTTFDSRMIERMTCGVCSRHAGNHAAADRCSKCEAAFCDDYLLRPGDLPPLCLDCALVASGIRRR